VFRAKKYPNRPLQTLVLGAPEFSASAAAVQAQVQKLMHSIVGGRLRSDREPRR
jgi:hypothetical protein